MSPTRTVFRSQLAMFYYLFLLICLAVLFYGLALSRRGQPRGASIAVIAALLCVTAGALRILWPAEARDEHPIKIAETRFAAVAAQRVGQWIAQHHGGADVMIILPFELRQSEDERQAMATGLTRGLGADVRVVRTVDPPLPAAVKKAYESRYNSADVEQVEIPEFVTWFDAAYLDALLSEHLSALEPGRPAIIISLAGLPEDSEKLALLRHASQPKLATVFGPIHALQPLIARGSIIAAADHHPAPNHEALPPDEDIVTAFDRRYLLITPENLAELTEKHQLFR